MRLNRQRTRLHPPRHQKANKSAAATLRHEFIKDLNESEIMGWFDGEILNRICF